MNSTIDKLQSILTSDLTLIEALIENLESHIHPFKITYSTILRLDGVCTEKKYLLIHNSKESDAIPIDSVAIVIECFEELDLETVKSAHNTIQNVKAIAKSDVPGPTSGDIAMTVSLIIGKQSLISLEDLSKFICELNKTPPAYLWPDAIAVLSDGIINYAANIPTQDNRGDFFLPAKIVSENSSPPAMFVEQTIRSGGKNTINKITSLIVSRLKIFEPSADLPNYLEYLKDFPSCGLISQTYQFNLANQLVPMTMEQAYMLKVPNDSFNRISHGKKLASIQFLKWQDGGIFVLHGKFPLDIFLIFLREVVPSINKGSFNYFNSKEKQISYVLPITELEFLKTLDIFQTRSSNVSVKKETTKFLIQQTEQEGTDTPFFGRLMLGIFQTRDNVFHNQSERDNFDRLYDPVITNLRNAREAVKDINEAWLQHNEKLASGEIVKISGRAIHISEFIDRALKRDLENFINLSTRTMKQSMQIFVKNIGPDIGFLFQKKHSFQNGLEKLQSIDLVLAEYISNVRTWSEPLMLIRNNDLEHGDFSLDKVKYDLESNPITAKEPNVGNKPITAYTNEIFDHLCCFVEEIITHCLQKKLPSSLSFTEIPVSERTAASPERFKITLIPGGSEPWELSYSATKFDEK